LPAPLSLALGPTPVILLGTLTARYRLAGDTAQILYEGFPATLFPKEERLVRTVLLKFTLLVLSAACGQEQKPLEGDEVLAEVNGEAIAAAELERFERGLPEHLRSAREGLEAHGEHLQSLVDRRLMLLEAEKRGLGQRPGLGQALVELVNERLAAEMAAELIDARLEIREEELRQAYEQYGLGWEVWPAHILSASEEEARQVLRLLEQGASFSELAKERSLAEDAKKGGNLGAFFGPGDAVPALHEATFHLEVGQVSEPIRTRDGYEVVKILDKRRIPFEKMRGDIAKQLRGRKWAARRREVVEELKREWEVRYHGEQIHAVLRGWRGEPVNPQELDRPLIAYRSGQIEVGAAIAGLRKIKKGALPPDSLAAFQEIEAWILPEALMVLRARAQGRHQRAELLAWKEKKRQELLVSQLRLEEVADRVQVAEAEARAYYEQHLDTYRQLPGPIYMTEVLVDTREQAEEILKAAQKGEPLEALAARYSVRPTLEPVGGHTFGDSGRAHIASLYQSPYRTFYGDDNHRDVGRLQGPLEVQDKYSLFRLDRPIEKAPLPYQQVRKPIYADLRQQKEGALFDAFLDSLRAAYGGRVRWFPEKLEQYAAGR
jgi:parvulin-like peptidyl-prolyl isomerase